jgi:WD40 repeat protein/serine/threonine protein kinase
MASMSDPSLHRVEELFHEAVGMDPGQRPAFLEARCAGDPDLRTAVEELLKHDDETGPTASFLASPVDRTETRAERPVETSTQGPFPLGRAAPAAPGLPAVPGYELLGELGRGGMGVVYRAQQTSLQRLVALKMLLTGAPQTAEALARFRTEAEALAQLQHPHIVQIYEIGEHEGRPYFALEYVAGPSLARHLDGQPQGARAAAELVEVLARAVDFAHQHGIIHRDLKPGNVLLQKSEEKGAGSPSPGDSRLLASDFIPKITDFGLAKFVGDGEPGELVRGRGALTETGIILGTPSYMAPEQTGGDRKGRRVGQGVDVYALGAILYELLTGRPPFQGETALDTLKQVTSLDPVPPRRLRPGVPRDLETICLKCLEKEPKNRYPSAGDLAEDLRRFLDGQPTRARPLGPAGRAWRWCQRRPVVAALLAVSTALALALVVSVLLYNARLQDALAAADQQSEARRLLLVQLNVTLGMRSLDEGDSFTGLLLLTEALRLDAGRPERGRNHRVRIATVLRQCPRLTGLLVGEGPVLCTGLGPGGSWVVAVRGGDRVVRVQDVLTGRPLGPDLGHDAPVDLAAFRANGRSLATACADGSVRVWDVRSGKLSAPSLPQGRPVDMLALHPDGRVLITRRSPTSIQLWDVSTGERLSLRGLPNGPLRYATTSDDARWVFTVGADQTGRVWDAATGRPVGSPLALGQGVATAAFRADGHRVALAGTNFAVRVWDVATGEPLGGPLRLTRPVSRMSFNSAGDQLITASGGRTAQVWEVKTGRLLAAALRHEGEIREVRFGPRGRLVVTAGSDNAARVWDAATGEAVTPPLRHNGSVVFADFSPDGRRVVTTGADGTERLWQLAGAPETGAENGHAAPATPTSPDGRRFLKYGGGPTVEILEVETGAPLGPPLRHGSRVTRAAFSSDGRLIVTASDDNTARVWDAARGVPLLAPLEHKGTVLDAAFSPDDRYLITAAEDHSARVWDVATGEPLTPPLKHPVAVARAYFGSDDNRAFTVGQDGVVRSWDLTPDDRPDATLLLLAQVLSGGRMDPTYGLVPLDGDSLRSAWRQLQAGPTAAGP